MTKYTGINHLALATGDMDATIRFWRDFLGMRLVAGLGDGKYRHYFFELSEWDMIAFFEWPGVEKLPGKDHGAPVSGPFGFDHVSIGVENDDSLWELKEKFEVAGMWVSEVVDHGFIHSIYAFDPNNIPIEFSAPVPGVDLRKNPKMADRHPCAAAKEGADPIQGLREKKKRTPVEDRRVYPGEGRNLR